MNDESGSTGFARSLTRGEFPVILLAAVLQGWSLYALHLSIERSVWPATSPGVLVALYATAAFAPLTVQMLARHVRRPLTWASVGTLVAFYLLIGWHYGHWVLDDSEPLSTISERLVATGFIVLLHWLLALPFLQARLIEGRWHSRYELLFSSAWNNALVLAETLVFTGIFWLLLLLWGQLFQMLGILFFAELFQEPIFVYPVTSIVFGVALKLIGSLERLTRIVLEQMLSVLKWLALLAGLILALFTVALVIELPDMISSGERAIGATWLLWLVAGTVLLVNAAYRDGSLAEPYPRPVGLALRCVVPLTVIITLVAIYALWLRIDQYGLTASRFWGCVAAGAALLYSAGYATTVRDRDHWMRNVAAVNVVTALYLIAVLTLALTPVLSPYRLAAASQFALAQAAPASSTDVYAYAFSPMNYLRFDTGRYGRDRLEQLSVIENVPRAEEIRREAAAALARTFRFETQRYDTATLAANIVLQPPGRTLEPELLAELTRDDAVAGDATEIAGVFVDLNRDRTEEFVLLVQGDLEVAVVYGRETGTWRRTGTLILGRDDSPDDVISRVVAGDFKVEPSAWDELVIGSVRYRMVPSVP